MLRFLSDSIVWKKFCHLKSFDIFIFCSISVSWHIIQAFDWAEISGLVGSLKMCFAQERFEWIERFVYILVNVYFFPLIFKLEILSLM